MACTEPEVTYVYIILVDGTVSKDGFFPEEEVEEARRVARKYLQPTEVKRIRRYRKDLT